MFITLINFYKNNSRIIKDNVEEEKYVFLTRARAEKSKFYSAFYEHSVESVVIDVYEFFVELDCNNNFFFLNLDKIDREIGHNIFKYMAMYHTAKIMRTKREINRKNMRIAMYSIFDFSPEEKIIFENLYKLSCRGEGEFTAAFGEILARRLFNEDIKNLQTLAFIENFCYNSYYNFLDSFTKYVTMERRLKME